MIVAFNEIRFYFCFLHFGFMIISWMILIGHHFVVFHFLSPPGVLFFFACLLQLAWLKLVSRFVSFILLFVGIGENNRIWLSRMDEFGHKNSLVKLTLWQNWLDSISAMRKIPLKLVNSACIP